VFLYSECVINASSNVVRAALKAVFTNLETTDSTSSHSVVYL